VIYTSDGVSALQPASTSGGRQTLRISAGNPNTRVVTSASASAALTGLSPANTYKVRVRALDGAGNASAWSDELLIVTTSDFPVNTVAATASVPTIGVIGATTPPQVLFTNQVPTATNVSEGVPVTIATTFVPSVSGTVTGGRFRAADNTGGTYQLVLFSVDSDDSPTGTGTGTVLATANFPALTQSVYNTVTFSSPVSVQANTAYRIGVRTSEGRYSATNGFFSSPLVNGNLLAPQSNTSPTAIGVLENGTYCAGMTGYPNQSYIQSCYFVDPLFVATPVGPTTVNLTTVAATAAVPTAQVGGIPPTLVMGLNRPVMTSGTIALDATVTPSGSPISSYLWEITAGLGSLTSATTAAASYVAPSSGTGTATVRLTVTATDGKTAISTMTVGYGPNIVAAENQLAGTPRATWDLASPNLGGVATLQGFCDGFSVNKSSTVSFKIAQSDAAGWNAEVYRLGYYGSNGARSYGVLTPTGTQLTASQAQPAPADADPDTTLLSADCSAWSTTLTWTPPTWAPSGMYVLRLNRTGGGASHVMFVLRDDARRADVVVMPADSTWNAYNAWGGMGGSQYSGNSLYYGTAVDQYNADCAHYVSYDRPVINRGAADAGRSYGAVKWSNFFAAEYPMVRFLERNGIDAKYYACLDAAGDSGGIQLIGNGSTRGGGKTAMMLGHNEYWSAEMRSGWEAASAAGVNIFTCASNEVFWRCVGTVNDSSGRPHIWECQKSTINGRGSTRPSWTGTWRDPDGAGKGGNNPENKLTGTIFAVNGPDLRSLVVPATGGYSAQPLWRHTSVASLTSGQSFTSGGQILGFEWDTYGPAGVSSAGGQFMAAPDPRARYCSDATYAVSSLLLDDAGDVYTSGNATHRLVVKPGGGNGMVFGTGTMNWAFGCDDGNVYQVGTDNTSSVIQQATVNMLVDMGAAPATLMAGLTSPTAIDWFVDAGMTTIVTTAGVTNFAITTGSNVNAVLLPITATASIPTMTALASVPNTLNTFDGGTVGTNVTTANSAASGTAFDLISFGTGGAVTYTASAYRGALAASFASGGTAAPVYAEYQNTLGVGSTGQVYGRFRFNIPVLPDTTGVRPVVISDGVNSFRAELRVTNTGAVSLRGSGGTALATFATTYVAGTWWDVGIAILAYSTTVGAIEAKLYNSSGTVVETLTPTANQNTIGSGGTARLQVGMIRSVANTTVLIDDVAWSTVGYPPVASAPFGATVAPAAVAGVAAVPSFTVAGSSTSVPLAVAGVAAVPSPVLAAGATSSPAVVAAVAAVPSVAFNSRATAGVSTVQGIAAVPAPSFTSWATVTPVAVQGSAAVPAVAFQSAVGAGTLTVQAVTAVATPDFSSAAFVGPATVQAVAGVAPVGLASIAGFATVQGSASVPAMTFSSRATAGLLTVQAIAAIAPTTFSSAVTTTSLTVQASTTISAPSFSSSAAVALEEVAASAEVSPLGIISGSATTVNLLSIETETSVPDPILRSGARAALAAVNGNALVPAPSVSLGVATTLTVVSATAAIPQPQAATQTGASAALASVTAITAVPVASVRIGSSVPAQAVVATAAVPQPQAITQAGTSGGLVRVAATAAVPAVTARIGSVVTGQAVNAQASVPTFAVRVTLVVRPTTVTATVTIWQPSFGTDTQIQLVAVLAKAAVPNARLLMVPLVFAYPHQVLVTRGTHSVTISRRSG
jgi:N,N-dimethylformamidase beta subunit-like protein/uncharacterized protein DUF4082